MNATPAQLMKLVTTQQPAFDLGKLHATPGAKATFSHPLMIQCLTRHHRGEWGDLGEEDKRTNDEAVKNGTRVFSAYELTEGRLWIITEADRSLTTFLLPSEY